MVNKLDLAENTRYCQAGCKEAYADVRRGLLGDVTWCYAPVRPIRSSAARVFRFHTDRILDHTGIRAICSRALGPAFGVDDAPFHT
jgi:hypothetical protein